MHARAPQLTKLSFDYLMQGPSGVLAGKVEDLGSGEYRAHFTATLAGSYAVSASVNGTSIAGSPFVADVSAVEVDAACSYAAGNGVLSARSGHPVGLLTEHLAIPQTSRNVD